MLATIEQVSADYWLKFRHAPRLVIGDISLEHGGRFGIQTGLRRSRKNIKYLSSGHETHFHVRLRL